MKTNTTKATAPAKMDAATIATTASAILKRCKTISAIKAISAASREKYGAANWAAIFSRCKEFRAADIKAAASAARENVFSYRGILGAAFKALAADRNFKALASLAKATYKGTDADTAAALVRDYYTNVDADGAPLVRTMYVDTKAALLYAAFVPARLSDVFALSALKACLSNMASAARKASRKAADTGRAALDNVRTAGAIVSVYTPDTATEGTIKAGALLTGPKATTESAHAAAVKSAAALVGRPVPSHAERLADVNAAARAAHLAAAEKALADSRAAIKADAAAAGVATTAPARKARKAHKTTIDHTTLAQ